MRPIEIRRMRPGEIDETVGVWERSRWNAQPWLEERMGYTHEQNLHHFREVVARESQVWLALAGGAVLGLLALEDGRIEQLFVDPQAQGRGVGTALLDKAKSLTPEGLSLFTHQRNARARAFHERRGFRPVRFGISPPPESEPDVMYGWDPLATSHD